MYIECANRERELGLEIFYTPTAGIGGRLRTSPEDFRVEEISEFPQRDEGGRYSIAQVTSTNWETNRLIRQLSKALRISRGKVGFAGTKDKRAVTTQLMSFEAPLEEVLSLSIHQVEIGDAYRSRRKVTIGDLIGNAFVVSVRDCLIGGKELEDRCAEVASQLIELGGFPNFFGIQRFGSQRPITHLVGGHIVRGEMEKAVMAYVAHPTPYETDESRMVREELERTGDLREALRSYPRKLTFERVVLEHLMEKLDDFAGAIGRLPSNLQMMFVHAYQSQLFNRILSERIRRGLPLERPLVGDVVLPMTRDRIPDHDKPIPVTEENMDLVERQVREGKAFVSGLLFGSESTFAEGEMGEIERSVVESEGVRGEDFIVPQLPHCSSKGTRRELVCPLWDFGSHAEGNQVTLEFKLGKGCYATCLLREFMKVDPTYY
jgi:tRNA pseudouridine13 synthase